MKYLLFTALALLAISCKKDKTNPSDSLWNQKFAQMGLLDGQYHKYYTVSSLDTGFVKFEQNGIIKELFAGDSMLIKANAFLIDTSFYIAIDTFLYNGNSAIISTQNDTFSVDVDTDQNTILNNGNGNATVIHP